MPIILWTKPMNQGPLSVASVSFMPKFAGTIKSSRHVEMRREAMRMDNRNHREYSRILRYEKRGTSKKYTYL
ncbi:MAG: hypothetical protein SWO11_10125 [Thermodesulfobacteriota bacterium]|nr:hypothetical protein [Thermodesulfobacteriota bacterium]